MPTQSQVTPYNQLAVCSIQLYTYIQLHACIIILAGKLYTLQLQLQLYIYGVQLQWNAIVFIYQPIIWVYIQLYRINIELLRDILNIPIVKLIVATITSIKSLLLVNLQLLTQPNGSSANKKMSLAAVLSFRLLLAAIVSTYISFKGQPNHAYSQYQLSLVRLGYVIAEVIMAPDSDFK